MAMWSCGILPPALCKNALARWVDAANMLCHSYQLRLASGMTAVKRRDLLCPHLA